MVERVEKLRAELQPQALREMRFLEKRTIEVRAMGSAQRVAARSTEAHGSNGRIRTRIVIGVTGPDSAEELNVR